jgi:hypothetical protein
MAPSRTRKRRRRDFVLRNAARIAVAQPKTAEKLLAHAINVQVATMGRRGISPCLIAGEAMAFENAIRGEVWRLVVFRGYTA